MKYHYVMIATLMMTGCSNETRLEKFTRVKSTCEKQAGVIGTRKEAWVGRYGNLYENLVYTCTVDGKFVIDMK